MNQTRSQRILILFAHPALQGSRVNRRLADEVRDLVGVTFHDLYQAYPDLDIDVEREKELLVGHDIIVFHHPFYWYSTPAILKEWQDLVLEHGWAYGSGGTALRGKIVLNALSAGGREEAYRKKGHNCFTVRELLAPIEQTARLCGMDYLPPFIVYGTHRLNDNNIHEHARAYRLVLEALRDGTIDLDAARAQPSLNSDLNRILTGSQR